MKGKVHAYVTAVCLCALIGTVIVALFGDANPIASAKAGFCFVFLGVFAQLLRYKSDADIRATMAPVTFLATLLLAPSWVALAGIASIACVGALIIRQSRLKAAFNISQFIVAGSAAILVYRSLGGVPLLVRAESNWPAYLAAYAVFTLLNGALVCMAVALSEQRDFVTAWVVRARSTIVYDVFSSPLAYLFAVVYVRFGAIGAMGLGLPLLAARQLYRTNWQLEKVNQELLQLMVAAIEARDPYTSGHSRRVARNAKIIARAIGLGSRDVERVGVAALLHDVGKIHEVFAPILRKPGKMTPDERLTMETHPIKSAELVQNVSHLHDVVAAIRNHHENWDGTGYPDGLRSEEIPLWSRIIMFADTIDAMTTDRPYRAAMTETEVRMEFICLRGKQFDPTMCDTLLQSALYPSLFERQSGKTPVQGESWRRREARPRLAAQA
jgi:putative nucleotidyltransferase with HDIG domain